MVEAGWTIRAKGDVEPYYCPHCGGLAGIIDKNMKVPEIEKITFTIDDKEFEVDVEKAKNNLFAYCPFCRSKLDIGGFVDERRRRKQ